MKFKKTLVSIFFIIAIGLTAITTYIAYRPEKVMTMDLANEPDAYMENVTTTIMDKYGDPSIKINSPKMVHFNKNDTTRLVSPLVTLYRHSPQPWVITSSYAKAINGLDTIQFWDNVLIHHPSDAENPVTDIETATLSVFPDKKIAQTNDPIRLIQPNTVINAIGMHADMRSGDIQLLSKARGEYEAS